MDCGGGTTDLTAGRFRIRNNRVSYEVDLETGYENGNTEPILDALKKHNATGTFFVVGHFLETALIW